MSLPRWLRIRFPKQTGETASAFILWHRACPGIVRFPGMCLFRCQLPEVTHDAGIGICGADEANCEADKVIQEQQRNRLA